MPSPLRARCTWPANKFQGLAWHCRGMFGSDTDEKDDDLNETSQAAIEAFVDTYNYTITSGKSSSDYETKRYVKQLNTLSKKHADELEDLGITINSDGTLDLNKDLLKTANNSKAQLLSPDREYPQKLVKLSSKMNSAVRENIMSLISTQNMHIDISL